MGYIYSICISTVRNKICFLVFVISNTIVKIQVCAPTVKYFTVKIQKTEFFSFNEHKSTAISKTVRGIEKMGRINLIALFITFPMIYICLYFSTLLAPKNGKNQEKIRFFALFRRIVGPKNKKKLKA